jgi:hypothetical protein
MSVPACPKTRIADFRSEWENCNVTTMNTLTKNNVLSKAGKAHAYGERLIYRCFQPSKYS